MDIIEENDSPEKVDNLLAAADELPHGASKIALCEEAVRVADSLNDIRLAYDARQDLVEAAVFGGRSDVMLVAFTWCVAQFDRDPEAFDSYQLLWRFKWVASTLTRFPQIDRPTIENLLLDMERRYRAAGATMQPVWLKRRGAYLDMGDLEAAAEAHQHYMKAQRGDFSDCHACEVDSLVDYYFQLGKNAIGLKKANEIFQGSLACGEVPHRTHAEVLMPLLKAADAASAMHHHRVGYPMIKDNSEFGRSQAIHMAFLALTGNDARALRLLEKHIGPSFDGGDPQREFQFLRFSMLALEAIAERKKKAKLRLPALSPALEGEKEFVLVDLATEFRRLALEHAGRYDERNDNDYHTRLVEETSTWKKYATPMSFTKVGGGDPTGK